MASLGSQSWGFGGLKNGISQYLAFGVKAYQHLEVATKTACGALHSGSKRFARVVHGFVDNKRSLLASKGLCNRLVVSYLQVGCSHDILDALGKGLFCLLLDGSFGEMVDISEGEANNDGHSNQYAYHIL